MKKLIPITFALILLFSVAAGSGCDTPPNSGNFPAGYDGHPRGHSSEIPSPREDNNSADTEHTGRLSVDISATNAYVLNVDTDSVFYQKNSDEPIAPASTVKMLTALTVLAYCSLDDLFIVGAEIDLIASDSSKAWLRQGNPLTVQQLLVALLLPSGNDAAYTLAVNAGRTIAGKQDIGTQQAIRLFVDAMNQIAAAIGATSSHFTNPDGYDEDGQYTTAYDLAQIAKACLKNDTLAEMMRSHKITDTWSNGQAVTYTNTNELINPESPYYCSDVIGLKTGATGDAGFCLASAAFLGGQTYICVVMGSSAEIRFMDCLTVFHAIDSSIPLPQIIDAAPGSPSGGLRGR